MSADQAIVIQNIRQGFDKGFFANNLYQIAQMLRDLIPSTKSPAACFILQQAALIIAERWEGRPVTVEEAHALEATLRPSILRCLELMENADPERLIDALDELVVGLRGAT